MFTKDFSRNKKGMLFKINGKMAPKRLRSLRIPPAWTDVRIDPSPSAYLVATGYDVKGRKQYLYSPEHVAKAKDSKFVKIRKLIEEHEDVRSQIEEDINNPDLDDATWEAALVAYLIYETGIRPGTVQDTLAEVQAFGATTLQLRHVHPAKTGVYLKFIGKKGVKQNVKVTNPYLVEELIDRKEATKSWSTLVFDCPAGRLRDYVRKLGSQEYTPKDLRTMRGTLMAMDLFQTPKRVPSTKSACRKVINDRLDKVASALGNTRAITRSAYVDPVVYERFSEKLQK